MYLCDEKRYLDSYIYNELSELKNKFIENYKYVNFFGFKTAELNNKEEISKILLNSIKNITIKIRELED